MLDRYLKKEYIRVSVVCGQCGNVFVRLQSQTGKFCSGDCYVQSRTSGKTRADYAREDYARHIESRRERMRANYAADPEKFMARNRARRARSLNAIGRCTPEARTARINYYGGRCWLQLEGCKGKFEHMDHVKPLSAGGSEWPSNMRPACGPCNDKKGSIWPLVGLLP